MGCSEEEKEDNGGDGDTALVDEEQLLIGAGERVYFPSMMDIPPKERWYYNITDDVKYVDIQFSVSGHERAKGIWNIIPYFKTGDSENPWDEGKVLYNSEIGVDEDHKKIEVTSENYGYWSFVFINTLQQFPVYLTIQILTVK